MKPVTEADIGPGGEAEWQRLRRQLELAEGFWLGFLFSSSPLTSGVLRHRTERLLLEQTRRLEYFHPESPVALKGLLSSLFTSEVASVGCTWVEALYLDPSDGTERPWRDAWLELVSRTNERRDALRRHLHGGFVLVAPPEMKVPIREVASDLWSIRALVLELPLVAEGSPRESRLNAGSFLDRTVSGNASEAESLTKFALAESERLLEKATGDDARTVDVLLRQVDALLGFGRTAAAVETARRARELVLRGSRGDPRLHAKAFHKLALAEKAHGNPVAASEHLEHAVQALEASDNQYRLLLLDELASLALWRGYLDSALNAYKEALDLARQFRVSMGDSLEVLHHIGASLHNVGKVQRGIGNLADARAAYEEALVLTRQIHERTSDIPRTLKALVISLEHVANIREALGDAVGAASAREEAQALHSRLEERPKYRGV